jgi:protein tyrosine phosphatase (PTP) superfamily phosphohydrolase (DUF442 family)
MVITKSTSHKLTTAAPHGARIMRFLALIGAMMASAAAATEATGVSQIFNYHEYSEHLLSAGQPTAAQFADVKAAGVELVINLAPASSPDAISNEGEIVRQLEMDYVHIPVDWEKPPVADVEKFLDVMDGYAGRRVLVHCYANARASAFVYLYRVLRAGHDEPAAHATMAEIWDLNPGYELHTVAQWQELIKTSRVALKR